jgi:hypothetical protein
VAAAAAGDGAGAAALLPVTVGDLPMRASARLLEGAGAWIDDDSDA